MDNFTHLHLHTCYSELDGLGKIDDYLQRAQSLGMKAMAVTDHGSTTGVYELVKKAPKYGIKPILGTEFYIRTASGNGHLIALAKDNEGWANILKLQHYAYTEGFYKKPCVDMKILDRYKKGIIFTSACVANPIGHHLALGEDHIAYEYAYEFASMLGSNFYIELQSSPDMQQALVNRKLVSIAQKLGLELILTTDCHYVEEDDYPIHEELLCMQTRDTLANPKRFKFDNNTYWMKDFKEIQQNVFVEQKYIDRALENTNLIADMCNATIEWGGRKLPDFPDTPKGMTEGEFLKQKAFSGYKKRLEGSEYYNDKYVSDIENELDVIERNGYSGYHLIVADYVNYARNNGNIVGDGRGSGAGCKVAYTVGITNINPDKYHLLFERFLADGREPDYDVDFSDREAVIDYLIKKYGKKNVALVGAQSMLTTSSCVRGVMSVHGHTGKDINRISKSIDPRWSLEDAIKNSKELQEHIRSFPKELITMRKVYGINRHSSTHAGGVVIYPNVATSVPIRTAAGNRNLPIIALDKEIIHELGYFKFDILGLNTLIIAEETLKGIEVETGKKPDVTSLDFADKKVYNMISAGDVTGVFQLSNQVHMLKRQKPHCFDDLIAINALIRPGTGDFEEYVARRGGKQYAIHPLREPYLRDTEGLITYQEQFLLDCKTFAGWDLAYADAKVRKNKNIAGDAALALKFISDSMDRGNREDVSIGIWEEIINAVSGGYSFNKSHSASYAVLSYITAWLKYYYPTHFYAAMLTYDADTTQEIGALISEAKRNGIKVSPPDINNSTDKFTAKGDTIFYKLDAIKDVGASAVKGIIKARPVKSLEELIMSTKRGDVKTNVLENLIKAGCFDFQYPNRVVGLNKLYGILAPKEPTIDVEWTEKVKQQYEYDALGLYLNGHPLDIYHYQSFSTFKEGDLAIIAVSIDKIFEKADKSGRMMGFIDMKTQYEDVRALVFSSNWNEKIKTYINVPGFYQVTGTKSGTSILIKSIKRLEM